MVAGVIVNDNLLTVFLGLCSIPSNFLFCQQTYDCLKLCEKCTFTVELERSMEIDRLDFGR